ncbi:sulfite exporter TauE/SafE family protein [uncultured Mesonia sp.]|uniref:sulfite exporter TauE/SafE family protein n=1 Tax=uncultured Mesonia sp. TaxID=399731 RepID=UPI00374FC223
MLWSAFLLGLLGSLHCVGMCGPIAFMLPLDRTNHLKKAFQLSLYHFGRLMAYSIMGVLFGIIGKGLYLFGFQQRISIAIGVVMILVVVLPKGKFAKFNIANPIYKLIAKVKSALGKELKKRTPDTFLTIGFLNGFLPCGLLYMAVFATFTFESMVLSTAYMLLFGLGTIPLMTFVVYAKDFLNQKWRNKFQKLIPYALVIIGILFILRGLGLGIPYVSPESVNFIESPEANFDCAPNLQQN